MIFTSSYKVLFKAFIITTTTTKMIYAVAQMCSVKKGILRNFASGLELYLKKDSGTGVFL